jgi:hypothetical protein
MAGQSHEGEMQSICRAFSPANSRLASETQGDALGWDSGAPSALGSADDPGMFPIRIGVRDWSTGLEYGIAVRNCSTDRSQTDSCDCPGIHGLVDEVVDWGIYNC